MLDNLSFKQHLVSYSENVVTVIAVIGIALRVLNLKNYDAGLNQIYHHLYIRKRKSKQLC